MQGVELQSKYSLRYEISIGEFVLEKKNNQHLFGIGGITNTASVSKLRIAP
jgi:hypothetical protein